MDGMPYGLARPTRRMTLGHELASKIGTTGADVTLPRVDDRLAIRACGVGAPPAGHVVVVGAASNGLGATLRNEMSTLPSQGCLAEINDVGPRLTEHAGRFTKPISHRLAINEVHDALQLVLGRCAAAKAVVTLGD